MNESLLDLLLKQASARGAGIIADRFGVDEATVERAMAGALPLIIGALARNASTPGGAASLERALARKHDGSLLDAAVDFLGGGDLADGSAILDHVFGGRRGTVVETVATASGLDSAHTSQLFAMLAPLVLAYLGRERAEQDLDADGVAEVLERQRSAIERAPDPNDLSVLGQLARKLLDRDRDGQRAGDAVAIGVDLLDQFMRDRQG